MGSLSGSIVLGDPRNFPGGGTTLPDSLSKVVQNPYQADTILIENRQSVALNVQPVVGAVPGSSTGGGKPSAGGIGVPALSIASVPIDPDADVIISIARNPLQGMTVRQMANGGQVVPVGIPGPRNIPYTLLEGGGGFHAEELYPLRDCLVITNRHNIAAGGSQQDNVVNPTGIAGTSLLVPASATTPTYPTRPWPKLPSPIDPVIVAFVATIESLGASSSADDLTVSGSPYIHTLGFPEDNLTELDIFSHTAAGANGLFNSSGIIPVPGYQTMAWVNGGATTAIVVRATYWVGVPHDPPTG